LFGREAAMLKIRLAPQETTTTLQLLRDLEAAEMPPQLRDTAGAYAAGLGPIMRRRDLQRIAWLLRSASRERLPEEQKRSVRRWAAYLEGRI
jgi:hypothetical protein